MPRAQFWQSSQVAQPERWSLTRYRPENGKSSIKPLDDFDTTCLVAISAVGLEPRRSASSFEIFIMGEASLRPKGVAFQKDSPAMIREEAKREQLGGEGLSYGRELAPGERWFVARVLPHQENRALLNLHRLGFRSFVPRLRRTIRHARRLRDTLKPLFPGYIFIIIDLSKHRWRSVNGTFGVASLIMGAEQPIPVPPGVVEALAASCESRGVVRIDDGLEIGQKVRIVSGPFAETLCRLAQLDDRGRVRVLLEIMGMEVAAQLDRSAVAPAA